MKLKLLLPAFFAFILISSCKKDETDPPEATQFSFSIPDSLVFEHSDTKSVTVSVQSESGKSFISTFETIPPQAFGYFDGEVTIAANQSGVLELEFYQTFAMPGVYTGTVRVAVPNENNAIKTKDISLIYRPNCMYDFRNHVYGQITYVSNGQLQNKTITCSYDTQGRLVVAGLTPYDVVLNADCANQTVSMVPLVNNGFYMTGSGQIEGNEIALQIFSDGTLHSNSRILLQ
ncbi:MAG: hypothetical protein KDC13_09115 [Bacteroidetes bacterium]|nr:hypothetical protein [Bacteroidota bacterium]